MRLPPARRLDVSLLTNRIYMYMFISQSILTYTYIHLFTDQGDTDVLHKASVLAKEAPQHLDAFHIAMEAYRGKLAAQKKT